MTSNGYHIGKENIKYLTHKNFPHNKVSVACLFLKMTLVHPTTNLFQRTGLLLTERATQAGLRLVKEGWRFQMQTIMFASLC